jgi:dihydrofolate reductase
MTVRAYITMSLDGFVAGPNETLEEPLGRGGERLHEWIFNLKSFRDQHGLEGGGETGEEDDLHAEVLRATGAVVMGRKMFSGGAGRWEDDPNASGWWGDDPPFRVPVFILTHHPRETVVKQGGTTFAFVTDGIESALEQARAAAEGKDVMIAGGATVIQQSLQAGLLDELQVHIAPVLLGGGVRLFEDGEPMTFETTSVRESPSVAHVTYRVRT